MCIFVNALNIQFLFSSLIKQSYFTIDLLTIGLTGFILPSNTFQQCCINVKNAKNGFIMTLTIMK